MRRGTVIAFLLGWALALLLPPRDLISWARRTAS